jgi:hypothetical protein
MTSEQREHHKQAIENAADLDELCTALNDAREDCDENEHIDDITDTTELPTFGGEELDGEGIYSWDTTYILTVGDHGTRSDGGWCIVPRDEWK